MATSMIKAQDAVWCDLCPSNQSLKSLAELHCKPCHTNLCQGCAGKHLMSKSSIKHDVVEYKLKEAETNYPKCHTHPGRKCELQCQQCQVPVCVMCLADSHQEHRVAEISALVDSKIAQIRKDNEELEKIIAPEYEKQDSEIEAKMSEKSQKYDAIITSIADHGQDWHKEVDKIINKYTTDVQKDMREDLGHLQKYQSEIKNTKSLIYQTIEKSKKILRSNDVTELANYRSRNDEFKQIPPKVEFSLPSFQPIKIQGNELLGQFGTLSASIRSEAKDYTIKTADHMSGALSLKQLLDQSEVITTTDSGTDPLMRMSCVGSDEVWISGQDTTIKRVNIHSKLLQKVTDVCRNYGIIPTYPEGLSVTKNGAVLYCDPGDKCVKMIQNKIFKKIHTVITLQDWWVPLTLCSSSSGDILVLVIMKDSVTLVRFSGVEMKQEIQNDHNGRPLFEFSLSNRYIEENTNQDICVQNNNHIVVLNQSGQLRFRYDGKDPANKYTRFTPRGIATDSKCQILVADYYNDCVHVIDKDGQFLCYIDNYDLVKPVPVSVDSQDRLWVGLSCGKIKVIQYMNTKTLDECCLS